MSKLPDENKFLDLSDYGRPAASFIAKSLQHTRLTSIHITIGFIIAGLLAIACIVYEYFWAAAFFLILKSILDAADGELARIKKTPSYTGRYLDSVSDIVLNLFILLAIWQVTDVGLVLAIIAFLSIQLQGTLYNYYYVILRARLDGDTTSRIFEDETPVALRGEKQKSVDILFSFYKTFYGIFDKAVFILDSNAPKSDWFPKWFMTAVSILGLGFQLLIIGVMLVFGWQNYIIPFFIFYSVLIFFFIGIRKYYDNKSIAISKKRIQVNSTTS
ncbi:MAG: CDP-alcohol phosphatidyltransferase family protein [Ignavibacteria bacterium]|nr:CDP-alcohol phosphatidyltransferase family protein [Ignavibacteria bacterium]MBT8381079.1 CDP-alcohol phosphatidyltransferase family protein [Ignavibacteria bacterium]NNL19977.1 CDP-alcohol phosphatidyltransferase family protein [Ignavibacteriaceae bacterium]